MDIVHSGSTVVRLPHHLEVKGLSHAPVGEKRLDGKMDTRAEEWMVRPGKSYWRGRLSTVDLLVLISLDQLLFIIKMLIAFLRYMLEEANSTDPSRSVSIPWSDGWGRVYAFIMKVLDRMKLSKNINNNIFILVTNKEEKIIIKDVLTWRDLVSM